MFERITRTRERISIVGTLTQADDMAIIIGIAAEQAGMTITDRDNPSVSELASEACRLGVDLCSLFNSADTAIACN